MNNPMHSSLRHTNSSSDMADKPNDDQSNVKFAIDIVTLALSLLAIVGNVFGVNVLRKCKAQQGFHIYVSTLLITNVISVVSCQVLIVHKVLIYSNNDVFYTAPVAVTLAALLGLCTLRITSYVICVMGIERLFYIVYPFKMKTSTFLKRFPKPATVLIATLNLALTVPTCFFLEAGLDKDIDTNTTVLVLRYYKMPQLIAHITGLHLINILLGIPVPLFLAGITSIAITIQLRRLLSKRLDMHTENQSKQQEVGKQMTHCIAFLVLFIILVIFQGTAFVTVLFTNTKDSNVSYNSLNIQKMSVTIFDMAVVLKAFADVLVFIIASSECRDIIRGMHCRRVSEHKI